MLGEGLLRALMEDPHGHWGQIGEFREIREDGGAIGFDLLRQMARVPIVSAIIETRVNQVGEFAHRQVNLTEPGFQLVLRETKRSPTFEEKKEIDRLNDWVDHCGYWQWMDQQPKHRAIRKRINFENFTKAIVRDSLRFDQACWEIVPNRLGKPLCWQAVDASTIRLNKDASGYVQVVQGIPEQRFTPEQMHFGVRRPRTDLMALAYGFPELEELLEIITAYLWGFQYNQAYFRQGAATKGILVVNGSMNPEQLQSFRRDWYAMVSGVGAAHRTPIVNPMGKDTRVDWISLQRGNQDMEFREWMNWLLKIACALYQIDPAEVGFQFGNEGQTSALNPGNPESRLVSGRDKGLRPLMRSYATWMNQSLIWPQNSDFELKFCGLRDDRAEEQVSFDKERASAYMMVDEIRAEHDLAPLADGLGRLILHPNFAQWMQVLAMNGIVDLKKWALPAEAGASEYAKQYEGARLEALYEDAKNLRGQVEKEAERYRNAYAAAA